MGSKLPLRFRGDDWNGPVEASLELGSYLDAIAATPSTDLANQRRCVRILSILYPELRRWLESWNLGQSFEPVYAEAQRRVYDHVRQLTPEQEQWMDALIEEGDQDLPIEARELRSQVIPFLSSLMTTDTAMRSALRPSRRPSRFRPGRCRPSCPRPHG